MQFSFLAIHIRVKSYTHYTVNMFIGYLNFDNISVDSYKHVDLYLHTFQICFGFV